SILFCRAKNPEREIWEGFHFGPEGAREQFGFDAAYPLDALDTQMPKLLADAGALHFRFGASPELERRIGQWLDAVRGQARAGVLAPAAS
ncbi:aminopeptidase P N-terminal domain-containing protein, partial [Staphylococcus aureus]|uniref:aminopeptidase P N-terminal domain-containing protein n=1 Tax=Staphylococcus aureus TaxID=1280 RepID=UPI0015837304